MILANQPVCRPGDTFSNTCFLASFHVLSHVYLSLPSPLFFSFFLSRHPALRVVRLGAQFSGICGRHLESFRESAAWEPAGALRSTLVAVPGVPNFSPVSHSLVNFPSLLLGSLTHSLSLSLFRPLFASVLVFFASPSHSQRA